MEELEGLRFSNTKSINPGKTSCTIHQTHVFMGWSYESRRSIMGVAALRFAPSSLVRGTHLLHDANPSYTPLVNTIVYVIAAATADHNTTWQAIRSRSVKKFHAMCTLIQ